VSMSKSGPDLSVKGQALRSPAFRTATRYAGMHGAGGWRRRSGAERNRTGSQTPKPQAVWAEIMDAGSHQRDDAEFFVQLKATFGIRLIGLWASISRNKDCRLAECSLHCTRQPHLAHVRPSSKVAAAQLSLLSVVPRLMFAPSMSASLRSALAQVRVLRVRTLRFATSQVPRPVVAAGSCTHTPVNRRAAGQSTAGHSCIGKLTHKNSGNACYG